MKRGDWTPIYMLIVVIIAAIVIVTLIKPLFKTAADAASQNLGAAGSLARAAIFS